MNAPINTQIFDEKEALEKLLSFEKKILNGTPPPKSTAANGKDSHLINELPEVLRAREALKLENPFRGK